MSEDRTAVVTGGTSGVGSAIVLALLRQGWRVIATGRNGARLEGIAQRAAEMGATERLLCVGADLTSDEDMENLGAMARAFSVGAPDALIHTAFGHIGEDEGRSLAAVDAAELRAFVDDSVTAALLTVKEFGPALAARGGRLVLIVADWGLPQHNVLTSGEGAEGPLGSEAYVTAKYALGGLAASVERQLGVSTTGIYPGVIASWRGEDADGSPLFFDLDSPPQDLQEAGYRVPDDAIPLSDVADAVLFALSSQATVRTIVLKPGNPRYTGL